MGFFFKFLLFLCSIVIHGGLTTAQTSSPNFLYRFCEGPKYTNNSPFTLNLNKLLYSLSSNASLTNKFYNTTIGQNPPDKAYGLFICRGDVTDDVCQNCVETATTYIILLCPEYKESTIYYDECMIRYSNQSIFSTVQTMPALYMSNTQNVSNPNQFNTALNKLMDELVRIAANGSSTLKFATGEENVNNFQKLYGMVQCTPDLSRSDCNRCLIAAVNKFPSCCDGKQGGRVLQPSCYPRYEIYPFYGPAALPSPSLPTLPPLTNTTSTKDKY